MGDVSDQFKSATFALFFSNVALLSIFCNLYEWSDILRTTVKSA